MAFICSICGQFVETDLPRTDYCANCIRLPWPITELARGQQLTGDEFVNGQVIYEENSTNGHVCKGTWGPANWQDYPAVIKNRKISGHTTQQSYRSKTTPDYPHSCPHCGAPAYIGGMNNVDCSQNCQ